MSVFIALGAIFDVYFYYGVKGLFQTKEIFIYFQSIYFGFSGVFYLFAFLTMSFAYKRFEATKMLRFLGQTSFFILFLPKILASVFLVLDDFLRGFRWLLIQTINLFLEDKYSYENLSRLKLFQIIAFSVFLFFVFALLYGIIIGGYSYRVKNQKLMIADLPNEIRGLKIIQISDLHLGSFLSLNPMKSAVKIINNIEADMLLFTGDLVNDKAGEAEGFIEVFKNIKHKVYSVMGNHDYPEYVYTKDDFESRQNNFKLIQEIHKKMDFE